MYQWRPQERERERAKMEACLAHHKELLAGNKIQLLCYKLTTVGTTVVVVVVVVVKVHRKLHPLKP